MQPIGSVRIVLIGIFMVVILGATIWLINSSRDGSSKTRADQQAQNNDKAIIPGKEKEVAKEPEKPREDRAVLEERRALLKVRLTAIRNLKTEIGEALTTLEQEVTTWETRIPALLKGVDGKKIAANSTRAEQFAGVLEKDPVSKTRVKQMREQFETLIAPIELAILDANSTYSPSSIIVTEIQTLGGEVRSKLRDFREIKAVVDTLQADSAFTPPGEKTLEKVILDLNAEKSRLRGELIAKAKKDSHDAESNRLAAAEAKAEQDLASAQLALLKARTDAKKEGLDLEAEEARRRAQEAADVEKKRVAKAKREAKFDAEYPKMKAYLIPFTSPGLNQFKGIYLQPSSDAKGPISFSKMLNNLQKDPNKTEHWARQMSDWGNDRPIGAFPIFYAGGAGRPGQLEVWYRVQDFLSEYGEIMVERKLLAP